MFGVFLFSGSSEINNCLGYYMKCKLSVLFPTKYHPGAVCPICDLCYVCIFEVNSEHSEHTEVGDCLIFIDGEIPPSRIQDIAWSNFFNNTKLKAVKELRNVSRTFSSTGAYMLLRDAVFIMEKLWENMKREKNNVH